MVCLTVLLISGVLVAQETSTDVIESRIVAVVGDEIILSSEVALTIAMLPMTEPIEDEETYNRIARHQLDELINEKLILLAAKDESLGVSADEVDRIWEERWNQIRTSFATEEQLEQALAREGYTLVGFKRKMKSQINDFLIKQRFIEKHFGYVEVSNKEVQEFYQAFRDSLPTQEPQIRLSVISIELEDDTLIDFYVQARIDSIMENLKAGVSFEELAARYSDDSVTASMGGDVGTFTPGLLPQPLDSVAFQLAVGDVSDPLKSPLGYHILKINGKEGEEVHLSHILLKVSPQEETRKSYQIIADQVYEQASSDSIPFEVLVAQYTENPDILQNNGDLGWLSLNQISGELRDMILNHEIGDVIPPIFEMNEFHIFKITDFKESEPLDLESNWDTIKAYARQQKQMEKLLAFLEDFKRDIYVDIRWENF